MPLDIHGVLYAHGAHIWTQAHIHKMGVNTKKVTWPPSCFCWISKKKLGRYRFRRHVKVRRQEIESIIICIALVSGTSTSK